MWSPCPRPWLRPPVGPWHLARGENTGTRNKFVSHSSLCIRAKQIKLCNIQIKCGKLRSKTLKLCQDTQELGPRTGLFSELIAAAHASD